MFMYIHNIFTQLTSLSLCIFSLTVSVCKFLSQPFLHRILPQRHGAPEGGTKHSDVFLSHLCF